MTDSDPVVRARELAAAATPGPWRASYTKLGIESGQGDRIASWGNSTADVAFIAEARSLVPVLCDIIDHYREREQHFAKVLGVPDGGQYRNDWDSRLTTLEELNVRLIHALRSVLDGISKIGGGSENFASELACWSDLGRIEGEARDLLAELSVTPETQ